MKKVVASVLVKNDIVVNSVGFSEYRPVSTLDHTLMRLQEWEVDEITVLNLSHTLNPVTDFRRLFPQELLFRIRTPLAYGGGIISAEQAESVISEGCERIVLSSRYWTPQTSRDISINIGDQAILMHLPLSDDMRVSTSESNLNLRQYLKMIPTQWGGEIYIKDQVMDGRSLRLDFFETLESEVGNLKTPIIVGGGISTIGQVESLLGLTYVKGVVVGNWLNRHELVIPRLKNSPALGRHLRDLGGFK
jgi:cyclase